MKTIKSFSLVIVLAILLTSCVIKSLHPFYTTDILYFEHLFVGNWLDAEKAHWSVQPFKEVILKENQKKNPSELSTDDLEYFNKFKEGYIVTLEKDSTKSTFLAMPFKIKNQLFLDFTPIEDKEIDQLENNLYKMHLTNTHSLAKLDVDSNDKVNIKWLAQNKIKDLINENRIKIKYEKTGFDETILLTASSEELVKFIEKYMDSKDENKWKTDVEFTLNRVNE